MNPVTTPSDLGETARPTPADLRRSTVPTRASPLLTRLRGFRTAHRSFLTAHRAFLVTLALGGVLRLITMLGYRSVMWFPDSFDYLTGGMTLTPNLIRPSGYSLLLRALQPFHSLALVALIQHLLGMGIAVLIYVLLRGRFGLPGWGATLAAAPVLFDAFQIQLEHLLMSDTLFAFLVMSALTVLLWRPVPDLRASVAAGLLLGLAAITRSVGLPLLLVALVYLTARRVGVRRVLATILACALPMAMYAMWFSTRTGRLTLTSSTGIFLYSRTTSFADCARFHPPVEELPLCVRTSPPNRPVPHTYIWGRVSPLHRLDGEPFSAHMDSLAGDFAKRAVLAQPDDYLIVFAIDLARTFQWGHPVYPERHTYSYYVFGDRAKQPPPDVAAKLRGYDPEHTRTRVVAPYAGFLRFYQRHFYLKGTFFGLIMLIGLYGLIARRRELGGAVLLPWGVTAALIVIPPATAQFDYRYVLVAVPAACVAAAMVLGRGRDRGAPAGSGAAARSSAHKTADVAGLIAEPGPRVRAGDPA